MRHRYHLLVATTTTNSCQPHLDLAEPVEINEGADHQR